MFVIPRHFEIPRANVADKTKPRDLTLTLNFFSLCIFLTISLACACNGCIM